MKRMSGVLTDRIMQLELAKLKKMNLIKSLGKARATLWVLSD